MRFADDDHTGADEAPNQRSCTGGPALGPNLRPAGRHPTLYFDQIFERDRNAVQGPDRMATLSPCRLLRPPGGPRHRKLRQRYGASAHSHER
jgi:hypothetical protein